MISDYLVSFAQEKGIPVQASVREGGGNNAAAVQTEHLGAPAVVAGVPVRYVHSANCITSLKDFEATVEITLALLKNLTPEQIKKF